MSSDSVEAKGNGQAVYIGVQYRFGVDPQIDLSCSKFITITYVAKLRSLLLAIGVKMSHKKIYLSHHSL